VTWSEFAGSGFHNWLVIAALVALAVVTVRAMVMCPPSTESHPDAMGSLDLRERGFDPVDGMREFEAHEARMNERAARLGYKR
jgi:hypothetical protein